MLMQAALESLFQSLTGSLPASVTRLGAAGSNRQYFRLEGTDGKTLIGAAGTSPDENRAFFTICSHLLSKGLPVPQVVARSHDGMCYLQQDLGDTPLFAMLEQGRTPDSFSTATMEMLEKTIRLLPDIQILGGQGLDTSCCFPCPCFDRRSIMWDLNYFKYCYLKGCGIEFHESRLEDDFENLTAKLLMDAPFDTFMYRDFQARNVMVCDGNPWFIDFQGGRLGPLEYDLVSFLYQARAAYPDSVRSHLIRVYLESLSRYRKADAKRFAARIRLFAIFRMLQVLGAYGYRGFFERKPQFLTSIPAAVATLKELAWDIKELCPHLFSLIMQFDKDSRTVQVQQPSALTPQSSANDGQPSVLTVKVSSFSYRIGIPQDYSGNGGGFVFDCRGMRNPGKFEQYKSITGNDGPVIEYLENQGEIQGFLECCRGLVFPTVDKYLSRGFTSLAVNFGCTGGQHRSVYCAGHMAQMLKEHYGPQIRIVLEHRELKIQQTL